MFKKIYHKLLYFLEEVIPMCTLLITVLAILIQVFFRYVLNISLEWPFELSIYGFIWSLYLGAAYARREGKHVKLDIVYEKLPVKVQAIFNIFFNLITIVIFSLIIYPISDYLIFSYRIKTVALKLPWTYVFGVFPIFLVLIIIHNLEYIIQDIKFLFKKN
jgi:TRAP-type C4-dicarboxylate transport system permease small subunit